MTTVVQAADQKELVFCFDWDQGAGYGKALHDASVLFSEINPDYDIRITSGTNPEKVKVMLLGGAQVDVFTLSIERVAEWANSGFLQPLDPYVEATDIELEDFFPTVWKANYWQGKTYGINWTVDANFPLFYNKQIFAEKGFNTEEPPAGIRELTDYSRKLTATDAAGQLTMTGIVPWWQGYSYANALYTWGWAFGGRFIDMEKMEVTPDHQGILDAIEWMRTFLQDFTVSQFSSAGMNYPNAFLEEKTAMALLGSWMVPELEKRNIDWGAGKAPTAQDKGVTNATWIGGHSLVMSQATANPPGAWAFIKWMVTSDEASEIIHKRLGNIPSYRKAAVIDHYLQTPEYAPFVQVLQTAQFIRPPIPEGGAYYTELDLASQTCMNDPSVVARHVMEQVKTKIQPRLDAAIRASEQ